MGFSTVSHTGMAWHNRTWRLRFVMSKRTFRCVVAAEHAAAAWNSGVALTTTGVF
jgi:hypothetical protein